MGSAPEHLLVVDDDANFRRSLERTLRHLGYRATGVGMAREAAVELERRPPAAILLDLRLPGIDGLSLLRRMRRAGFGIPVIVMSGAAGMDDLVEALRNRADDFLRKPCTPDELRAALRRALGRQATRAALTTGSRAPVDVDTTTSANAVEARPASLRDELDGGELRLPSLSPLAAQIHRYYHHPPDDLQVVIDLLSKDTSLCAVVLRAAAASRLAGRQPLRSVRDAVIRLGTRHACAVAHEYVLAEAFSLRGGPFEPLSRQLAISIRGVATTAQELARLHRGLPPDEVYLAALLHDVGALAILQLVAERHGAGVATDEQLEWLAAEAQSHHEAFGRAVLAQWELDARLVRLAGNHHPPFGGDDPVDDRTLRSLVHLAWSLVAESGWPLGGEPGDVELLSAELGLDPRAVRRTGELWSQG